MLDIHTHILPGMDDGSSGADESIGMLKLEAEQGVQTVVLSPHFYPDRETPAEFLARRQACADVLWAAAKDSGKLPKLLLGAETAFYHGISRSEGIERLCIGDTNAILVEMPFGPWNERIMEELYRLREQRGLQPVIAHVERYLRYLHRGAVDELCARGMLLQANASFFIERTTARTALKMLKKQQIHLLGSDCHNMKTRKPNIGEAINRIYDKMGDDGLDYLAYMQDLVLEEL